MSAKKDSLTECLQSGTTISPATDTMFCSTAVNEKAESTGFTKKFRTPLHAAAHPRIMVLSLGIWCSAWVYGAHLGYTVLASYFFYTLPHSMVVPAKLDSQQLLGSISKNYAPPC